MPGNILNADTGFPRFQEGQSNSDKIDIIMNYLYMLLEQLRYSMGNLDEKNFSPEGLEQLQKVITEPVYIELQNAEGDIARIGITADGLTTRLERFGVTGYDPTKSYKKGDLVDKDGTVYEAKEDVAAGAWDASKWEAKQADEITAEARHSELTQTVDGFTLRVENGPEGSTIGLYSGSVLISSPTVKIQGLVVFTPNPEDPDEPGVNQGYSIINGGFIKGQEIQSSEISSTIIHSSMLDAATIIGGYIYGSIIHGGNGLYGPEVLTRKDTGETETTGGSTKYIYQQTLVDSGEISFSINKRAVHLPYSASPGADPTYSSIHSGQDTLYGKIYADYDNSQMYISTMGTYKKQLKLESGMNMSLTATLETSESGDTPTYYSKDTDTSVGLRGGTIYIGTEPDTRFATNYGQKIMIGSAEGHVVIAAHDDTYGNTTRPYKDSEKGNVGYEFRTDGIYFHGRRIVDSSQTV